MSSSCKIAIVGGGLAGLAAANSLKTVGIKAEVFEAAPALGEIGAAVNSSPQAVKALRAIGVGDKVAAVAHLSHGIYTRNMQTGEFLEFNDRHKAAERFGAPYYTFHRADLLDALASGLDHSATHLGHRQMGRGGVVDPRRSRRDAVELPQPRATACEASQPGNGMLEVGPLHAASHAELGPRAHPAHRRRRPCHASERWTGRLPGFRGR